MITIRKSQLIEGSNAVKLCAILEHNGVETPLWYSVDPAYAHYLTPERQDGFLVGLLASAMRMGEDLRVEGVVSERLFYNLTNHYMRILSLLFPRLRQVKIEAEQLDRTNLGNAGAIGTGFSGGVDSFCVVWDHLFAEPPKSFRLTHCVNASVGAHGRTRYKENGRYRREEELFHERCDHFATVMDEWKIPLVRVNSNLHELVGTNVSPFRQLGLTQMHTPRNVSAVLVLQKLFSKYLYASAFPYEECFIGPTYGIGYSDPMSIHLLSTETMECVSSGCQHTRVRKTALITGIPASYRYLNVCSMRQVDRNCSGCNKCLRTLLTLEVLGKLDLYSHVFDLDRYRRLRSRYLMKLLAKPDIFFREILKLAEERNFSISPLLRVSALLGLSKLWPSKRSLK
jgi:hypothetical protein